jgi:hypothetical protein
MNNRVCKICGADISGLNRSAQYCSENCKKERDRLRNQKNKMKRNQSLPDDTPTCPMCGMKSLMLITHITRIHGMTEAEFKVKYPDCQLYTEEYLKEQSSRVKGDKNYFYGHGAENSPFSKHFVGYQGKSDAEMEQCIRELKERSSESHKES